MAPSEPSVTIAKSKITNRSADDNWHNDPNMERHHWKHKYGRDEHLKLIILVWLSKKIVTKPELRVEVFEVDATRYRCVEYMSCLKIA